MQQHSAETETAELKGLGNPLRRPGNSPEEDKMLAHHNTATARCGRVARGLPPGLDPMVLAIRQLELAEQEFELLTADFGVHDDYDAVARVTFDPLFRALAEGAPVVVSMAGAVAAIQRVLRGCSISDFDRALLQAVDAFLSEDE